MKNLVAGEFKDASNGAVIEVYNPATNELLDIVPNATKEDVDECVKKAVIAQKEWAKVPLYERGFSRRKCGRSSSTSL